MFDGSHYWPIQFTYLSEQYPIEVDDIEVGMAELIPYRERKSDGSRKYHAYLHVTVLSSGEVKQLYFEDSADMYGYLKYLDTFPSAIQIGELF